MSTRTKLILIVLLTSIAGASTIFVNSLVLRPVKHIEEETEILDNLKISFIKYIAQANQLVIQDFQAQNGLVEESRQELDRAFAQIGELQYLPAIDGKIRSSLDTISLFATTLGVAQKSLDGRIAGIIEAGELYLGKGKTFTIFQLGWGTADISPEGADMIKERIFFLSAGIVALNKNAAIILENLDSQYASITEEIERYESRARKTLVIILLVILTVPMVIALFIANMLADRIRKIEVGISRMKNGDLADRIEISSNDEMGRLSRNVNDFTDALSLSILQIQEASRTNTENTDRMRTTVELVSQAYTQATASAQSICEEMNSLDRSVGITEEAARSVDRQLGNLDSVLSDQVSMIEEASASISEMIASISSVSDITLRKKESLSKLVEVSREGGSRLDETNRVISTVHESIEEIQDTTSIIANIASRTNLLAMNAAIEAAHAGEAGRGFSVVAEEIRKLAEATTVNSKRIGGVMKSIIGNIEDAVESGTNTGAVFERVDREVSETSASFDEIASSMSELKMGGTQILDAMGRLNDISGQVQDSDVAMREAFDANKRAIEEVDHVSQVTVERVKQITEALETLAGEMARVTAVTEKADAISETLRMEVKKFVLSGDRNQPADLAS